MVFDNHGDGGCISTKEDFKTKLAQCYPEK